MARRIEIVLFVLLCLTVNANAESEQKPHFDSKFQENLDTKLQESIKELRDIQKAKKDELEARRTLEPVPIKNPYEDIDLLYPVAPAPIIDKNTKKSLALADEWLNSDYEPQLIDNGNIVYFYGQNIPTVVVKPHYMANIEFSADETIVVGGIQLADKVNWIVKEAYGGSKNTTRPFLFIKCKSIYETETSLIVLTTKRTYHIRLLSTESGSWTPSISYAYPHEPERSAQTIERLRNENKIKPPKEKEGENGYWAKDISFNYEVSGSNEITPLRVYNVGHQTVIEMREDISRYNAPTLLLSDTFGQNEIVNYRFVGNKYIIDQQIETATLISGVGSNQLEVKIKNLN